MATATVSEEFSKFLNVGGKASTHTAKFLAFSEFLEKVFDVEVEELVPGIEKKIGSKILGVRGSIDLLFSDVILEFKTEFQRELDQGKTELVKYFQSLLERDPNRNYIAVITDCLRYAVFLPSISNGKVAGLEQVGQVTDISTIRPESAMLFIDSFLFSKKGLKPTAVDLSVKFGPGSPTYALALRTLKDLWQKVAREEDVSLKLKLWTSNMSIVYGAEPPSDAFLDQTYLVTLVKLLIYLRLSRARLVDSQGILDALTGEYFSSFGISNLIEEDYFSWILAETISSQSVSLGILLARELLRYDTASVDEDLFKEIYQTIVKRAERHRTGEYYTPEWLCEITLDAAIRAWDPKAEKVPRVLDPACGSGTFLTNAIHWVLKRCSSLTRADALDLVLQNIVGIDVNPVAVVIARANYILALGENLQGRKGITIPVFVSDSIKIPTIVRVVSHNVDAYDVEADGTHLQIPATLVKERELLQKFIQGMKLAVEAYRSRRNKAEATNILRDSFAESMDPDEFAVVKDTTETILTLLDKGLDSIWIFVLSNIYAPVVLKEGKFDIVIGNPPWIVMHTIENKKYQDFLKSQVFAYGLLGKDEVRLFTHMEMATLFFCRASDLYLKESGITAFLMPISVITAAQQHASFKKFMKPRLELLEVLSFEKIRDIFSLPVCVLLARKGGVTRYPVRQLSYSGKINRYYRNQKLDAIKGSLGVEESNYDLPRAPTRRSQSHYFDLFKEGATLVPRSLWFVDFDVDPILGIDVERPKVKSAQEVLDVTKKEWAEVRRTGRVESEYIYATILGKDLIPFGFVKFRPIVLPLEPTRDGFMMLSIETLRLKAKTLTAEWVAKNQMEWEKGRTEKSEQNYPLVTDRLDHNNLLTGQNPSRRYLVIYNARGADAMASVIDKEQLPAFSVGTSLLKPRHFVADTTDFFYETNDDSEAHYVAAILNSTITNKAVKKFQPRGQYGFRDIGRRPFMYPIPEFQRHNPDHQRLARLSHESHSVISQHSFSRPGLFKSMRNEALRILSTRVQEIDAIVAHLVKT